MKDFKTLILDKLFNIRPLIIVLFFLCTCFLAWKASHIYFDAGYKKVIPLEHEYMKTFVKHKEQFGGGNQILIALENTKGDIFQADILELLKTITDEVFFIEGVDRSQVTSLFTPNVRYIEVVEGGFAGGPVIPADFKPTKQNIDDVRRNAIKAGIVGLLVSNDFSSALINVTLQDVNPATGKKLDCIEIAKKFEKIRHKYENKTIKIHIIGFAKMVGDIADGLANVVMFFGLAIIITFILVLIYCRSIKLSILTIICSIIAVIWQLGLLNLFGFGMDPMAILVPFLIFAIAVSHGMQMINGMCNNISRGMDSKKAAKTVFQLLFIPGGIALITDSVGFMTLFLIKIEMIRELAINASMGVAVIILTNLVLLPVLLSYFTFNEKFKEEFNKKHIFREKIWKPLSNLVFPKIGLIPVAISIVFFIAGLKYANEMKIGDLHAGAPALHSDSRYNTDTAFITERFSIGVDVISIITEAPPNACTQYKYMEAIDRFHWHMENVEGVQSVMSLPKIAKIYNAAYNEGNIKWRVLSRNTAVLTQSTARVKSSSGLLNSDCSVMPIIIYTKDHKAQTIDTIIKAAKEYIQGHPVEDLKFRLATGPVGIMAAKNEAVAAAQCPMFLWVYGVIILLCLITYKSLKATLCVVIPLLLVSFLAQAFMAILKIGLNVSTLPILALGVGIGVDYGIYIISPMLKFLKKGMGLQNAFYNTLKTTGSAVFFTGLTLAVGVSTWIFSCLKFQVDIGILLTFMFLLSMLGAIFLLPALAGIMWNGKLFYKKSG